MLACDRGAWSAEFPGYEPCGAMMAGSGVLVGTGSMTMVGTLSWAVVGAPNDCPMMHCGSISAVRRDWITACADCK